LEALVCGAERLEGGLAPWLIGLGLIEARAEIDEGLLGDLSGGAGLGEASLGLGLLALKAGERVRVGRHGGELFLGRSECLLAGIEFAAQTLGGETLIAERRGGGAALGMLFFQPGDFGFALLEAAQGLVEFGTGLTEAGQVGLDGGEVVLGLAERAARAGLAGRGDDRLSGGGEAEAELLDDGIEFDSGETGADALADVGVVETGPDGRLTLARPKKAKKAPMFRLGGTAPGQRGLQEGLHALISCVGVGDQFP
jgi:hypothetical protein